MDSFNRSNSYLSNANEEVIYNDLDEQNTEDTHDTIDNNTDERIVEKRNRPDSDESKEGEDDNEGFTTVLRRKKRIHRSFSKCSNENNEIDMDEGLSDDDFFEVCLFSKQTLPKQFGMAKLLKADNITNILKIKYKGPFKCFITLKYKLDAEKLLKCQKLSELDVRCQYTSQLDFTYGIVKEIDLDIEEKEMLETFESIYEISSVRRLKRLDAMGKWIDSTAVRFCFKSNTLPPHIVGYGCRFKVEKYIFPVSQCSTCWKFGHMKRFCPTNKIKCAKCGDDHDKCDTNIFFCINCKGKHLAIDKKALSVYLQELSSGKELRVISTQANVSEDSVTYKQDYQNSSAAKRSYSEVTKNINENEETTSVILNLPSKSKHKKKKEKKQRNSSNLIEERAEEELSSEENTSDKDDSGRDRTKERKNISTFYKIYYKIKQIILSESSFEKKITFSIKIIIEEFMHWCFRYVKEGELLESVINIIKGGS
ncbi:uncharacterized protein LOC131842829 [Achroia grisella]|uniref:uncharacterized protein LOC131842829 n=1 Tax=Achroia grisella TaxID=688607 RepID=UPI0027D20CCA|nr:uncharacterized protein LOC131842829 [Achroia grisella]